MRNGGSAIWQGFDFEWNRVPHRLHRMGSWIGDLEANGDRLHGTCASHFSVGRVPDGGKVRTYLAGVRSQDLRFREGSVRVALRADIGEPVEVLGREVRVPVLGDGQATVVLRGFRLHCTSHEVGLHPQGIGLRLDGIEVAHGELRFRPHFYVHPTNSPDFITTNRGGYAFEFEALYTVITGARDSAAITVPCHTSPCVSLAHARGEAVRPMARVEGLGGRFNRAVLGLRGFRWEQQHASRWGRNGRFLRRFQVHIGPNEYDAEAGAYAFRPKLEYSNAGLVAYPIRAEHQLWTTLVQYTDHRPTVGHMAEHATRTGLGDDAVAESRFDFG